MRRRDSGRVAVFGATAEIGRWAAHAFARRGYDVIVAARDVPEAERVASDLSLRHDVRAEVVPFDARDDASQAEAARRATADGRLAGAVLAFGALGDHPRAARDAAHARDVLEVNFTGAVVLLTHLAPYFAARGAGFIAAVGSVAGDRGRQSNYVYGAAKGGLAVYLQGLRNALAPVGVDVITVKSGFVDTAMTYGRPGVFLAAHPRDVGEAVARAVERRRWVTYTPWFWRYVMLAIGAIPEGVFRRTKL